jgi:hypothetical protein
MAQAGEHPIRIFAVDDEASIRRFAERASAGIRQHVRRGMNAEKRSAIFLSGR